jgi:hypothetical protein
VIASWAVRGALAQVRLLALPRLLPQLLVRKELERERCPLRGAQLAAMERRAEDVFELVGRCQHPHLDVLQAKLMQRLEAGMPVEHHAGGGDLKRNQQAAPTDVLLERSKLVPAEGRDDPVLARAGADLQAIGLSSAWRPSARRWPEVRSRAIPGHGVDALHRGSICGGKGELAQALCYLPAQLLLGLEQRVGPLLAHRAAHEQLALGEFLGALEESMRRLLNPLFLDALERREAAGPTL